MQVMKTKLTLFTVILLVVAAFGGMPVSAQTNTVDPIIYDAEIYAKAHGITVEEALRRLTQQASLGEIVHILEVNEPETYAGFWVEHTPVYKMVAAFTTDPAISRELVYKYFPESTAAAIEIRRYEYSYVELQEIRSQTVSLLKSAGIEISGGGLYVTTNRIKIMVLDIDVFNEAIQTKQLELYRNVDIIEGTIVLDIAVPSDNNWIAILTIGLSAALLVLIGWWLIWKRQLRYRLKS